MTFYYYIVILHYSKEKSFLFSGKVIFKNKNFPTVLTRAALYSCKFVKRSSLHSSGKEKRIFNVSVTLKIQVRSYFMDKAFADEMISEYQKK